MSSDLEAVSTPDVQPVPIGESDAPSKPLIARAGQYYRNTRYIMTVVTIVMGFWFLYDGFVRYPAENAKIDQLNAQRNAAVNDTEKARVGTELKNHVLHSQTDLLIQRILAFSLPPCGLLLLAWAIYNSRGGYRLTGDTLSVPGHPPVTLADVQEMDETSWDRKGIAYLRYKTAAGLAGRIKLDDFVYDRVPTDAIVERIRRTLQAPISEPPVIAPPVGDSMNEPIAESVPNDNSNV